MTDPQHAPKTPPTGGNDPPSVGATIGVFAKHWTPGETKTRLAASIGAEKAADVSKGFVETLLSRLATVSADDHLLAFAPAARHEAFAALPGVAEGPWRCEPQVEGSLGERMEAFFRGAGGAAVLVGSDSPDLPLDAVRDALAWLANPRERGLVLGPTSDGGYWLIGTRGELPPIFADMPWSDASLLAATKQRLSEAGWQEGADYQLIDPWYDVDEASDLARLRRGLNEGDGALRALASRLDDLLGTA
ncbi:MAG: TIGR04282 family arsenosugar biosynthesis glycosyltransferase [Planctomycetota bacterium]